MIDILVYLFETYGYADACPAEPEQLARKLSAAGFEQGDISEAIEWLSGLRGMASEPTASFDAQSRSVRIFTEEEQARLDTACQGFLHFLEANGTLDARQRELIIERAMALPEAEVSLSKFKVIVLMVLWQQQASMDTLILDELLTEETDEEDGDWTEVLSVH
ncbi:DUF494 domain-containing protein [Viridibacterium curvum]|uniref:Protein Smg homolog n=1 Tax=Viridibacterium curvum TaxID=1101404 RepID=A0ABP9QMK8_9RHOO